MTVDPPPSGEHGGEPVPAHRPGSAVGDYVIEGLLGRGGMATVYLARDRQLDRRAALKILNPRCASYNARFRREGRVLASLRHDNVVQVYGLLEQDGMSVLALEYVEGPDLDQHLRRSAPLPPEEIDAIARGILRGVAAAHDKGIVHRDLKPSNMLLADGVVKVSDFGLAKVAQPDDVGKTRSKVVMGTPAYMAPEQFRSASRVDHRADIWAVGCVLYELVAGRRAFPDGDVVKIARCAYPHPKLHRPDALDRWVFAIEAALRAVPDDRPASCGRLMEIWDGTAPDPNATTAPLPEKADSPPAWGSLAATGVAFGLAGALVAVGLGFIAFSAALRTSWGSWFPSGASSAGSELALAIVPSTVEQGAEAAIELRGSAEPPVEGTLRVYLGGDLLREEAVSLRAAADLLDRHALPTGLEPGEYQVRAELWLAGASEAPHATERGRLTIRPPDRTLAALDEPSPAPSSPTHRCDDPSALAAKAGRGALTAPERACLRRATFDPGRKQTERVASGTVYLLDSKARCDDGGECGDYEKDQIRFFEEVSRSDAEMMYVWAAHLHEHDCGAPDDAAAWASRALPEKHQWDFASYSRRVDGLYEILAREANEAWKEGRGSEKTSPQRREGVGGRGDRRRALGLPLSRARVVRRRLRRGVVRREHRRPRNAPGQVRVDAPRG